jgi:hypothetical protein
MWERIGDYSRAIMWGAFISTMLSMFVEGIAK